MCWERYELEILNKAKLIVFDLDGTLYEDTDHFDYYAERLAELLKEEDVEAFFEEYNKMKNGEHAVGIGKAYDVQRDAAVTLDPMSVTATEAHNWQGEPLKTEEVEDRYPDRPSFDFENMIAIGDGWWLPYATARHFGISPEAAYMCYNATKDYMATDAFQMTKTPGLKAGLEKLGKNTTLVLLSNSEKDDVARIIKNIDLDGLFDEIVPSATKPAKSRDHFERLLKDYDVAPEEAVTVGDNFMNEIAPALALGMKAVCIHQGVAPISHKNLVTVPTLANVL